MDLNRKFEMFKTAVNTISRHDDETLEKREALFEAMNAYIAKEHNDAVARVTAKANADEMFPEVK